MSMLTDGRGGPATDRATSALGRDPQSRSDDPETRFDVIIVGAGDIGAAVARELARFELRVALIDRGDVGSGASRANTAIVRSGFALDQDSREARLVSRGRELLLNYAQEVGIPVEPVGATMVAWSRDQLELLDPLLAAAHERGHQRVHALRAEQVYEREPALAEGARGGLELPDEYIVCPWTPPLAWATQAALAGVAVMRGQRVTSLRLGEGGDWLIGLDDDSTLTAGWVVNSAGLGAAELDRSAAGDWAALELTTQRRESLVFDKLARGLVNGVILPLPDDTRGGLIAPTVFGNVLVQTASAGAGETPATATTRSGISRLRRIARRILPSLLEHEVTAAYAGLETATGGGTYELGVDAAARYARAGGTGDSGLTAAMAIAEELRDALADAGLALRERPQGLPELTMPNLGEAFPRPYRSPLAVDADPAYGEIVCFCEQVTGGELRDALHSVLPPDDLDGLRRRTRVTMGRCQGTFCAAQAGSLLERSRAR